MSVVIENELKNSLNNEEEIEKKNSFPVEKDERNNQNKRLKIIYESNGIENISEKYGPDIYIIKKENGKYKIIRDGKEEIDNLSYEEAQEEVENYYVTEKDGEERFNIIYEVGDYPLPQRSLDYILGRYETLRNLRRNLFSSRQKHFENKERDSELEKIMRVARNSNIYSIPLPPMIKNKGNGYYEVQKIKGATDGHRNIVLDYFLNFHPVEKAKTLYHEIAHNIFGSSESKARRKAREWLEKYGPEPALQAATA